MPPWKYANDEVTPTSIVVPSTSTVSTGSVSTDVIVVVVRGEFVLGCCTIFATVCHKGTLALPLNILPLRTLQSAINTTTQGPLVRHFCHVQKKKIGAV